VGATDVRRVALEVAARFAMGYAGWHLVDDALVSVVLAVVLPLGAAVVWGVFRVDGDPKVAPVPVPGVVRLCIEVDFFGAAVVLPAVVGQVGAAVILGAVVVGHYAWGYRRGEVAGRGAGRGAGVWQGAGRSPPP